MSFSKQSENCIARMINTAYCYMMGKIQNCLKTIVKICLKITRSKILLIPYKIEMGRKFEGSLVTHFLWIGITRALFSD